MMRTIGFFLLVFALGLLGLLVVSGDLARWFSGPEARPAAAKPPPGEAPPGGAREPNEISMPFYDLQRGRLEYTIRGRIDESEMGKIQDIREIKAVTLYDGELEVPIYDEVARDLPPGEAERKPRRFLLLFRSAEYSAIRPERVSGVRSGRESEKILLRGGGDRGRGITDDGTEFHFEELHFEMARRADVESAFTIRSEKPVRIRSGYMLLESPNGFRGSGVKGGQIETFSFSPPVWTYLEARAGRLFSLAKGGDGAPPPISPPPSVPPERAAAPSGPAAPSAAAAQAVAERVAITCAGPLTFQLSAEPKVIRFEKDVVVFPIRGPGPELGRAPPVPGETRFDCQLLTLEVDSNSSPPRPTRAEATTPLAPAGPPGKDYPENGRVRALHAGNTIEGERLVWTLPASAETGAPGAEQQGEAVLSGKPTLVGKEGGGRMETGEMRLKLDEDRILLLGGLSGDFSSRKLEAPSGRSGRKRQTAAGSAPASAPSAGERKQSAAPRERLPERWDFRADEGELTFAPAGEERGKPDVESTDPLGDRVLKSFRAWAEKDGHLHIKSRDGGLHRLEGKSLEYDAFARTVTVVGDAAGPRFHRKEDQGTARSIRLRLDEGVVELRGDVAMTIQEPEADLKQDGAGAPTEGERAPTERGGPEITGPVEVLADEVDLRYGPEQRFLGADARGKASAAGAPGGQASLRSLAPEAGYRLSGGAISWDQAQEVATVTALPPPPNAPGGDPADPQGAWLPRLEHDGGALVAEKIRFDRKRWRVSLLDRVVVRGWKPPPAGAPAAARRGEFELRADRADVDLTEPSPLAAPSSPAPPEGAVATPPGRNPPVTTCPASEELKKVKGIHAWAEPGGAVEMSSPRYRARAGEASWDAGKQEVHLFGDGRQEIAWRSGERESALTAKDIVYLCAEETARLTGEVKGEIHLRALDASSSTGPREGAKAPPSPIGGAASGKAALAPAGAREAAGGQGGDEPLVFQFETSSVDARLEEKDGRPELRTLQGKDRVLLTNEKHGLRLRGDDLFYDHATHDLRVFSQEGRFQTLTRTRPAEKAAAAAPQGARPVLETDQIDAREIALSYQFHDASPGVAAGSRLKSVLMKFRDDVTATFHTDEVPLLAPAAAAGGKKEWKLQSEHLAVKLVPDAGKERMVQLGLAEGSVIFSSADARGEYMATAQEAFYEEAQKRLTLRGSDQKPVRLLVTEGNPPKSHETTSPEITVTRLGESSLQTGRARSLSPEPAGISALRRKP